MKTFTEPFSSGILEKKIDILISHLEHISDFKGKVVVAKDSGGANIFLEKSGVLNRVVRAKMKGSPGHPWTMDIHISVFGQPRDFSILTKLRLETSRVVDEVEDDPHEYVQHIQPIKILELEHSWTDDEPPENSAVAHPIDEVLTEESLTWAFQEIEDQIVARARLSESNLCDGESMSVTFTTYVTL